MTATVEFDNFTVFTYENLLIHASPPPVKYSLHLRRYYLLTPWPECKGPWSRMTAVPTLGCLISPLFLMFLD